MSLAPLAASLLVLAACYSRTLATLMRDWLQTEHARHGFPVVLFVMASIWQRRVELPTLPQIPLRTVGLALVIWGALQTIVASLGVELFLGRTAFLIALAGVVLFHLGWRIGTALATPWFLLWLAIPLPAIIYNPFVGALQAAASAITETLLSIAGVPLRWEGTAMQFAGGTEQVRLIDGYGCLRLFTALVAAAMAYGEWMRRGLWMRAGLVLGVIMAAIVLSSLRIVLVAWLDESVSTGWALRILDNVGPWTVGIAAVAATVVFDRFVSARQRVI